MSISVYFMIFIAVLAVLDFVRAVIGPTAIDRIVATSAISTKGMVVILVLAVAHNNTQFVDVALVLALCGFIGLLGLLRSMLPEDASEMTEEITTRPEQLVHFVPAVKGGHADGN